MKQEELLSIIISVSFGIFLFVFNNFLLSVIIRNNFINIIFNAVSIFLPLVIIFLIFSQRNKRIKEIEFYFSSFLRDLVEGLRSGRSIVKVLESLQNNDYKSLSLLVRKMYLEVKMGIPFEDALNNLAKRSESVLVRKMSLTVSEAVKAGGDAASVIEGVIRSFLEVEKVRREREMISAPTKINGFMIYFMFLIIMVILIKFLIPAVGSSQQISINLREVNTILLHLVLIQSLFSGLMIGKMSEGSIYAGLRYSIILMLVGYLVFSFLSS